MSFPTSPVNGQIATVNNIDYIYNSVVRSWTRLPASSVLVGNLTVTGNIVSGAITPATDNTGFIGNTTHTWANGQFTNLTVDSVLSVRAAIDLADNDILRLGSGDDWEFFHDGTDNYIDLNVGDLRIRDNTTQRASFSRSTGNLILNSTTGATSNVTGALIVSGGVGVAGNVYMNRLYTTDGLFWAGNGDVISTGGGSSNYRNSTITSFPVGNYGNLDIATDAFGVHVDDAYDLMDPAGSYISIDLNV